MVDKIIKKILENMLKVNYLDGRCIAMSLGLQTEEICELIKLLKDPQDIQFIAEKNLRIIYSDYYGEHTDIFTDILRNIIQNFEIDKNKLNEILYSFKNRYNELNDELEQIKSYCGF